MTTGRWAQFAGLWLAGALLLSAQDKPRVFVAANESWAIGESGGGSKSHTVEVMKMFRDRCPDITVTSDKSKSDFAVQVEVRERYPSKVAVFDKTGDLIFTGATRFLKNGVKDACTAITKAR
jgi:hypothetical protein